MSDKLAKERARYLNRQMKTKLGCGIMVSISIHPEEKYIELLMDEEFKKQRHTPFIY